MTPIIPLARLEALSSELRPHAPHWADRISQARSKQDLLNLVCLLFNLANSLKQEGNTLSTRDALSDTMARYISKNLNRGITLKVLARFLGYSEKYCSGLFHRVMGESFSRYVRRQRVEQAGMLLATSGQTVSQIAITLGFRDHIAFSHFFKRATGHSPLGFRAQQHRPA